MAERTAVDEHWEGVHDQAFHVASDERRSIDRASFREDQARDVPRREFPVPMDRADETRREDLQPRARRLREVRAQVQRREGRGVDGPGRRCSSCELGRRRRGDPRDSGDRLRERERKGRWELER